MPATRRPKPIDVVEARRLYEQTNLPVDHIAAMHGIGRTALYRRIHIWGWRMRRPTIPLADPPREPDEIAYHAAEPDRDAAELDATAARIRRLVECELDDIERTIGSAGEGADRARRLASLARTLQEVTRLPRPAAANDVKDADDRGPDDDNDFIRELVRRMDEFARRGSTEIPAEPSPRVE
jgi:hypothetical protein